MIKKRILYVTKFIPAPAYGGGLKRNLAWLKFLSKYYEIDLVGFWSKQYKDTRIDDLLRMGLNIYGFVLNDSKINIGTSLIKSIFQQTPVINNKYYDKKMKQEITELCEKNDYDFVFFSEVSTVQYAKYIGNKSYFFDDHNVEYELIYRTSQYSNFPVNIALHRDSRLMKKVEAKALNNSAHNFFVSERDMLSFSKTVQKKSTAVNNTYEDKYIKNQKLSKIPTITFVGSIGWKPNHQGLKHFIKNIYSTVKEKISNIEFNIIGSNISQDIKCICEQEGVNIYENATEKLKDKILDASWLTIVPVYFGSGTRIKILEYWSHSKVVVSTTIGAEGLPKSKGTYLVDKDEDMVKIIIELLKNYKKVEKLGNYNYNLFKKQYDEAVVFNESLFTIINNKK